MLSVAGFFDQMVWFPGSGGFIPEGEKPSFLREDPCLFDIPNPKCKTRIEHDGVGSAHHGRYHPGVWERGVSHGPQGGKCATFPLPFMVSSCRNDQQCEECTPPWAHSGSMSEVCTTVYIRVGVLLSVQNWQECLKPTVNLLWLVPSDILVTYERC